MVARRAALEDDLESLDDVGGLDFAELGERADRVRAVVARVAALATGRLQVIKEMRELDDRLGLSPKAMAQLRWTVEVPKPKAVEGTVVTSDRWQRGA
jgi:hypothetical protein